MILSKPEHIKIYGHRGARGDLPENTLKSFKYLFENDISAYETDIVLSKDHVPVINHDFRLNPALTKDSEGNWITNDDIKIYDLTYEQLSKFTIGSINKKSEYGRKFDKQKNLPAQEIPKLSDLLELTSRNILDGLLINLEIKSTPIENNLTPHPDIMAKLIIDEVNKFKLKEDFDFLVVDFHGEITSEKNAIGHYFDGRASLVVGTHTHIPTNDARILQNGTAYQTDAGMCGDYDSVIGMNKNNSLNRFMKKEVKLKSCLLEYFLAFFITYCHDFFPELDTQRKRPSPNATR